jgi:hypothetical protein
MGHHITKAIFVTKIKDHITILIRSLALDDLGGDLSINVRAGIPLGQGGYRAKDPYKKNTKFHLKGGYQVCGQRKVKTPLIAWGDERGELNERW